MTRIRATAVVIKNRSVLLIHRRKNGREYYVFPGGSVEDNETPEQTVVRELLEETSIKVEISGLVVHEKYADGTENYTYFCKYISGEPKLDDASPEKKKMLEENDFYEPLWVEIEKLKDLNVFPAEAKNKLIAEYKLQ